MAMVMEEVMIVPAHVVIAGVVHTVRTAAVTVPSAVVVLE